MLDLFSGIGGFSLAASWVWGDDLEIAGFCEIDEYCEKVLNKNFPGVPVYKDITQLDGKQFKNIDLITGGFPCQDISVAGRGAGLEEGTRSGLWFEMLRIISEVRPRYALIENVPKLTIRGGTRVIADLTEIGYDASWTIISAKDLGAWHKRARIWIVAYPESERRQCGESRKSRLDSQRTPGLSGRPCARNVPGTNEQRLERHNDRKSTTIQAKTIRTNSKTENISNGTNYWSVEPRMGLLADGVSTELAGCWDREPDIPRVTTGIKDRVHKLRGLGNAIVPQVAYYIMKKLKL